MKIPLFPSFYSFPSAAVFAATLFAGLSVAQAQDIPRAPINRYSFDDAAGAAGNGTVIKDSTGATSATVRGAGSVFTGVGLDSTGGERGTQGYVDLANGIISNKQNLTFEFWETQHTNQTWARIIDFGVGTAGEITAPSTVGSTGTNYVMLTGNIGDSTNQKLERGNGAVTSIDTVGTTVLNVEVHVVVTYDDTAKQWRWYRNGTLMASLADTAGPRTINDVNNWIGRSQYPDKNWDGLMNEFRIYNYSLNQAQISSNTLAGPGSLNTTASVLSWTPTAGGTFDFNNASAANNWGTGISGAFPNAVNATATVASNLTGDQTVQLNGAIILGALAFGDFDASHKFNIAAGAGGSLTMQTTVGNASIVQGNNSAGDTLGAPLNLASNTEVDNYSIQPMTFAGALSGTGELNKGGQGQLHLTGDNSGYGAAVTVYNGQLHVGNGGSTGTLGSGFVTLKAGTSLVFNRTGASTAAANITGPGQIIQNGPGTVTYTGAATSTAVVDLNAGTLILKGSIANSTIAHATNALQVDNTLQLDPGSNVDITGALAIGTGTGGKIIHTAGSTLTRVGQYNVGASGAGNGLSVIEGGTLNIRNLSVGRAAGTSGAVMQTGGDVKWISGSSEAGGGDWIVGGAVAGSGTAYGSYAMSGGTLTSNVNLQIGGYGRGIMNLSGTAAVTATAGFPVVGRQPGGVGILSLSGNSSFSATISYANLILGEQGTGIVNLSENASINVPTPAGTPGTGGGTGNIRFGQSATSVGILNLNGGTVTGSGILEHSSQVSSYLYLNGGTIRASVSNATYLQGIDRTTVGAGGVTFDTNGNSITVGQALLAPTGQGVSGIALAPGGGGSGYIGQPIVQLTGGGGTGATALAVVNGAGELTGFQMTNPGVNYTSAPTVALLGGGFTTTAVASTPTLGDAITTGGLTKTGAGTLTLSGVSTYGGATQINQGTLNVAATGSISASSVTNVNLSGTLTGVGQAGAIKTNGGTLAPGDGVGTLNASSLEFAGGNFLVQLNGTGAFYDQVNVSGLVNLSAPTTLTLDVGYAAVLGDTFTIVSNASTTANLFAAGFTYEGNPVFEGVNFGAFSNFNGDLAFQLDYTGGSDNNDYVLTVVPEPGSAVMLVAGLGLLAGRRRRQA